MTTSIILFILLGYVLILFKKSKSNFFNQSRDVLAEKRQLLIKVLEDFEFKKREVESFLFAFDKFRDFPNFYKFDGATIVADIYTIKDFDAPAMLHDFRYTNIQKLCYFLWLKKSLKYDLEYVRNMRKLKVLWFIAWGRFFLLLISKPLYPLTKFKL